jgi:hypothetical protein
MYIKGWFKPIFPIFLTRLPYQIRFLIPTVDFAPPPPQVYLPNYAYANWPIFLSFLFSIVVAAADAELW